MKEPRRRFLLLLPAAAAACRRRPRQPDNGEAAWWAEKILSAEETRAEIGRKIARTAEWIRREGLGGVEISTPWNLAWLSAGALGCGRGGEHSPRAWVRSDGRVLAAAEKGEAEWLSRHELDGLGWDWRPLAWHGRFPGADDWLGGRPCASDGDEPGAPPAGAALDRLRLPLLESEIRKLRWLGRRVAQSLESTCRRLKPGMTESGIAALAAGELERRAIEPARVTASTDMRAASFAEPRVSESDKLERLALVRATGRRWGLHATLTRLAHVGPIPAELAAKAETAARLLAGCWARTEPGRTAGALLQGLISDAAEAGVAQVWEEAAPGGGIGYREQEWTALPGSDRRFGADEAYTWRAGVGGIRFEETILLVGETLDPITLTGEWPLWETRTLDRVYRIPAILAL